MPNFRDESQPLMKPVIFGVPYEGGTYWRKGTKEGPKYIKEYLEKIRPINLSTKKNLAWPVNSLFSDDLELDPYNNDVSFQKIQCEVLEILKAGGVPITLGGDHSITIPALRAVAKTYGSDGYGVIHIDAHSDTFPPVNGYKYHHGAVFKVAIEEGLLQPKNIVQFGIRGAVREGGNDFVDEYSILSVPIDEWKATDFSIKSFLPADGLKYYLSFDIDVVDPAFAPGTGTPVPGGLSSLEALNIMRKLNDYQLLGADLVEVAPVYDIAGNTSLLAAYLLFELLANAQFHYKLSS